jgi:uncharacterized membrane protein
MKIDNFSNHIFLFILPLFKCYHFIPASGNFGGIFLGFNDVILEVISVKLGYFSITVLLRSKWDNFQWALTIVYGPVLANIMAYFWMEVYSLGLWCSGAWVIWRGVRDFNVIRSRGEGGYFF